MATSATAAATAKRIAKATTRKAPKKKTGTLHSNSEYYTASWMQYNLQGNPERVFRTMKRGLYGDSCKHSDCAPSGEVTACTYCYAFVTHCVSCWRVTHIGRAQTQWICIQMPYTYQCLTCNNSVAIAASDTS
jgi:hypothetical protein